MIYEAARRCDGPIAEFGCGEGSTQLLHEIARARGLRLVSLDTDPGWLRRYSTRMASPTHEFRLVDDWQEELASAIWDQPWGLALVDQAPWEARADTVRRLRDKAEYVVVHDCDYLAASGLLGTSIRPLRVEHDVGERDWGDAFSSWQEFALKPWPGPSGPPTLLGSNNRDCEFEIDFAGLSAFGARSGNSQDRVSTQVAAVELGSDWASGRVRPDDGCCISRTAGAPP